MMQLKQFIGKDVRGRFNYELSFRDGITFLIGMNGSGKTTVLSLISGLLCPSYFDLALIKFSYIHIKLEYAGKEITIKCLKSENKFQLSYIEDEAPEITDTIENIQAQQQIHASRREFYGDNIAIVLRSFEKRRVVQKIKELPTPLFLGLNRRAHINDLISIPERDNFYRREVQERQYIVRNDDMVNNALDEIQQLCFENIRQNTKRQYALSEIFRKKVFSESFRIENDSNQRPMGGNYDKELRKLEVRRQSLYEAIAKLGLDDITSQFSEFFKNVEDTLQTLISTKQSSTEESMREYTNALVHWLLIYAQVEKVDNIIKYANEYNENIQHLKDPILRFVSSVNLFFKDGHKKIRVEESGDIIIEINGERISNGLYDLSSGEKQLIIMLAHLAFYKQTNNSTVYIIDEPELSLHISWQEKFVDALLEAAPEMQFILATHAPAIIAKRERKEWCEDLSKVVE